VLDKSVGLLGMLNDMDTEKVVDSLKFIHDSLRTSCDHNSVKRHNNTQLTEFVIIAICFGLMAVMRRNYIELKEKISKVLH
jgi:hypothetical protein